MNMKGTTMDNDFLKELWDDADLQSGDVDFGGAYGVGTWPNAVLMEVEALDATDFGYRIKAIFNLKGEEGMKYTGRIDLPRTVEENGDHDLYERTCKRVEKTRNNVSGILLAAGLLPEGKKLNNVDGDAPYERVLAKFRDGVGAKMPLKVSVQRKYNKSTEKWEDTDFTQIEAIRPRK